VSIVVPILYAIGVLATVFHFSNGIWTMGITWGWWTSPAAQRRATILCTIIGVGLSLVGLTSVGTFMAVDPGEALQVEKKMLKRRVEAREIPPAHHKALPEMADIFEQHGFEQHGAEPDQDHDASDSTKTALTGDRSEKQPLAAKKLDGNTSQGGTANQLQDAPPAEPSTTKR